ncbi:MAG TPA: aldo/keto reductase, partial [Anaerolineales bacterium]|nr:aldo/keto reductase [Anaerolineales bacterium]
MEYRKLGRSGVFVSPLCLGAMNFGGTTDEAEAFAIMRKAVEAGINFFDTANVYNNGGSENIVGKFLKENNLHDQVVLATKVNGRMGEGPNDAGLSRYHIVKACEASLRRLQTDHIDLYQLHRPPAHSPEETLRALDDLIHAGKVLYIGCSTHPAWMVMEALSIS